MKLLNDAGKEIFKNGLVSVTKRGAVPPVSCNMYLPPINTWFAPHDIKDYGDTDESICWFKTKFDQNYLCYIISI